MESYFKQKCCCKNCAFVTYYKTQSKRYECAGVVVSPMGICDKFQKNMPPSEIIRRIDRKMKELESYSDGKYEIADRPDYRQNYRVQSDKELKA